MNTKFNFFNKYFTEVCEECNGNGYYEVFAGCNVPQSDCCGGCYASYDCEECDSEGIVYDDLQERIQIRKNYKECETDIKRFRRSCWISLHMFKKKYKPFKKL